MNTTPSNLHSGRNLFANADIRFREFIDADTLDTLLKYPDLRDGSDPDTVDERILLRTFRKAMSRKFKPYGTYHVNYDFAKNQLPIGRVYPKKSISLGSLRKELRHTLAHGTYTDIDIANAHPVIIHSICKHNDITCPHLEEYVNNREDRLRDVMTHYSIGRKGAKEVFLVLMYGGSFKRAFQNAGLSGDEAPTDSLKNFQNELRRIADVVSQHNKDVLEHQRTIKKPNPKSTTLSLIAQEYERRMLEVIFKHLVKEKVIKQVRGSKGRKEYHAILCFDGIMVPTADVPSEILRGAEARVASTLGCPIRLEIKPMDNVIDLSDIEDVAPPPPLETDDAVSRHLIETFPNYFHATSDGSRTAYYNEITGTFVENNDAIVQSILIRYRERFPKTNPDRHTGITRYWADNNTDKIRVAKSLSMYCPDDDWMNEIQDSSIGKLLLKDGWYDMDTQTFHRGFTPDIAFYARCPVEFEMEWNDELAGGTKDDIKRMLRNRICDEPVRGGSRMIHQLLHYIARAVAGNNVRGDKNIHLLFGATNSGKGTLTNILQSTFGSYVGIVQAEHFANAKYGDSGGDSEQKNMGFLLENRYARLLLTSELRSGRALDTELLKKVAGGGDTLEGRRLYSNSTKFIPHGTVFLMVNNYRDLVDKADDAFSGRLHPFRYDHTFVKTPRLPHELPQDESFKPQLKSNKYWQRAFFEMIMEAYNEPDGVGEEQSQALKTEILSELCENASAMNQVMTITKSPDDIVPSSVLKDVFKNDSELYSVMKGRFKTLEKALTDAGVEKRKDNRKRLADGSVNPTRGKWIFSGLRLITDEVDETAGDDGDESLALAPTPVNARTTQLLQSVDDAVDEVFG
ncbi:MAG: hypothetical protein Salg2KO_10260 [Salibacteraceae bacterium]